MDEHGDTNCTNRHELIRKFVTICEIRVIDPDSPFIRVHPCSSVVKSFLAAAILLFVLFCGNPCPAADKSGVGPNTISLPKGPGAIEGLGESFQPHLNTGTAGSSMGFKLPPGTAGQTPSLGLSYEGGSGNGPVGFGWSLPMSAIQRRSDKGIPTYGENIGFDRPDVFINDAREELVPQASGYFFCKNEGAFIRYQFVPSLAHPMGEGEGYWIGTSPNGTRMEFGLTADARIQDPAATNHIFSWLLQRDTDTHGNVIVYSYTNFPGSNNLNQKYLSAITYGPGSLPWPNFHFVSLLYEDRPDWFEDCRSGFIVRTGKRLKEIVIGTQGPTLANHLAGDFNGDGQTDYLDRKYVLNYLSYAGTNSHWSLLAKVTLIGADAVSSLPPATYGYSVSNPPDTLSAAGRIIGGDNEPPVVMDNPLVEFLDLNGDGLPDILATEPGGGTHTAYLNRGQTPSGGGQVINWQPGVQMDSVDGRALLFDLQSTAPIAHLADMDGDGIADLAVTALDGSVLYFQNTGNLLWGPRQDMTIQDTAPLSPFGNSDVRTADLDFDKRIDIIQSCSTGNGADYQIWFNLGNQNYSASVTVPQAAGVMFSTPGVQIADFNGDRVPDIAQITPSFVTVTAGLGYGRFADPITVPISDLVLDDTDVARATLMDINGDGLADLVLERAAPGELWYWLNLGNYTFSRRKVITGMPKGVGANAVVRWADINGNGTTDLIYADSSSIPRMQAVDIGQLLNNGVTPNIMGSISNGIGRVTTISYLPSTIFSLQDAAAGALWPDLMPNPVQVVASITTLDSLGHQYVTQFRYHNGYYDPSEKQFRGFASAEQIDVGDPTAPTLVTRSFFDTGRLYEAMKGKVLALSVEQEDGSVFSVQTNLWTIPPVTLYTGTNGTNVVFAHPTGKVSVISELGQGMPRRLESECVYDNYGNKTTNANYGIVTNGDRTAFDDERIVTTEFALNFNSWIIRLPARQEIKDENGVLLSRVENYYDDETFSAGNFGGVTVGDLTLVRAWITASNSSPFIQANRSKYDAYGNPITLLDPLASAQGGAIDFAQGHARQVAYESRFHTYPTTETIHIGNGSQPLSFQAAYDEAFGTVSSATDCNANTTSYTYDEFGRLINIVRPYDTAAYPTVEYAYVLAVPFGGNGLVNYIETRRLDKPVGQPPNPDRESLYLFSRQFTDGLGRKLMTKTEAEPAPGSSTPRTIISEATVFNARQKPLAVLNPCFSLNGGSTLSDLLAFESIEAPGWQGSFQLYSNLVSLDLSAAHKKSRGYDAVLRPTAVTNQDGSFNRTIYEPLLTRSYDENQTDPASPFYNNSMVYYEDGLGRLIQVDEVTHLNDDGSPAASLNTWTTRYEYDLNDELTHVTDSQNNVKTMAYDGLRRKTFMDDPDRGRMTLVYDDASNLSQTSDAKNQLITYTYDGANRILTENYHDGLPRPTWRTGSPAGGATNSVAYFYDLPVPNLPQGDNTTATVRNTLGMLAWVLDLSGEEHFSYDARSRVEYSVKRIPDPVALAALNSNSISIPLVSFRTSRDYDSLDRVIRLVYPDNDEVAFQFNDRSLLQQIVGGPNTKVISGISYLPSGQPRQIDYGNGVRTLHDYDSRLRMNLLDTRQMTLDMRFLSFAYAFDPDSNIQSITDRRPTSAISATDPRRNTQAFSYDDLYRLTRVQYNLPNPSASNGGEIDYRYDRIGNMLAQSSDITNLDRGLPAANVGTMASGGAVGTSKRLGRAPGDPPGPHALTSIQNPASSNQHRAFPYDANGNMTVIDGLTNTWDFKDRLVACENGEMRATYSYDYADHRISKTVWPKTVGNPANFNLLPATILYVNNFFEVRECDAPTKYVFNEDMRLARVSGSLSQNPRIQRLRVYPGWNLCSLAVTASDALSQLSSLDPPLVQAAYKWVAASTNWLAVSPGESLPAGTVLWLNAATNAVLTAVGPYVEPASATIAAGGTFLPSAGLEAWPLTNGLSADLVAWVPALLTNQWQITLPGALKSQSALPAVLGPGRALFVQSLSNRTAQYVDASLRIRYYHQDHLGSSSVISDASGQLVEENAFYPFGNLRTQLAHRTPPENYTFAGKELDQESSLQYFQSRFHIPHLGRFNRVDPALALGLSRLTKEPQRLGAYAYCLENPLKHADPEGAAPIIIVGSGGPEMEVATTYKFGKETIHSTVELRKLDKFKSAMIALASTYGGKLPKDTKIVIVDTPTEAADALRKSGQGGAKVFIGHTSITGKMVNGVFKTTGADGFVPREDPGDALSGLEIGKIVNSLGGNAVVIGCYGSKIALDKAGRQHPRGPENWADFHVSLGKPEGGDYTAASVSVRVADNPK